MKKLFLGLIVLCAVSFTSGCSNSAVDFIEAYDKTAKLKSYEIESNLKFNLNAELSDEILEQNKPFNVQSLLNALSDFNMSTTGKRYQNAKGEYKGEYKFNITAPDADMSFSGYEYGMGDDNNFVAYIPTLMRSLLPREYEDARFVSFSSDEIPEYVSDMIPEGVTVNNDYVKIAEEYGEAIIEISKKMFENVNVFDVLSKKNNVYTITLTDADLKNLIRSLVTEYFENPTFREYMTQIYDKTYEFYVNLYGTEFAETIYGEKIVFEPSEGDFEKAMEVLAEFENISIIGEDGIVITFKENYQGYISEIVAKGAWVFDAGEIQKLNFGEDFYEGVERYSFGFEYSWNMSYAGQVKNFTIPEFNNESCINIFDWVSSYSVEEPIPEDDMIDIYDNPDYKDNVKLPADDGSITFFDSEGIKVNFDIQPIIRNGVTYIADSEFTKIFTWYYLITEKDEDKYRIETGSRYPFYVYPDKKELCKNGYKILINNAPFAENGVLYLPLKDFANVAYDEEVVWNETEKSVTVQY